MYKKLVVAAVAALGSIASYADCFTLGCVLKQSEADAMYMPAMRKNFLDIVGLEFEWDIKSLASTVIVNTSCKFSPEAFATRAEALKIVLISLDFIRPGRWRRDEAENPFSDVSTSDWFYEHVMDALSLNLVSPNTTFRPNDYVTRQEFSKMVYTALSAKNAMPALQTESIGFTDSGLIDPGIAPMIDVLTRASVISGFKSVTGSGQGTFRPSENITRAHVAKIVSRAFFPDKYVARYGPTLPDQPILSPVKDFETASRVKEVVLNGFSQALDANGFNADKLTFESKLALMQELKQLGLTFGFDQFGGDGQIGGGLKSATTQIFNFQKSEMAAVLQELDSADDLKGLDYSAFIANDAINTISSLADISGLGIPLKLAKLPRLMALMRQGSYIKALSGNKKFRAFMDEMDSPRMKVYFAVVQAGYTVTTDIYFSDDYKAADAAGALKPFFAVGGEFTGNVVLSALQQGRLSKMMVSKATGAVGAIAGLLIKTALSNEEPAASLALEIGKEASEFIPVLGGWFAQYNYAVELDKKLTDRAKPYFAQMLTVADDHRFEQNRLFERTLARRLQVILQSSNVYLNTCDRF